MSQRLRRKELRYQLLNTAFPGYHLGPGSVLRPSGDVAIMFLIYSKIVCSPFCSGEKSCTFVGTAEYVSPEVLTSNPVHYAYVFNSLMNIAAFLFFQLLLRTHY